MLQNSLVVIIFALMGLAVAVHYLIQALPILVPLAVLWLILSVIIGRRSLF